jgi:hypothetical protein
MEGKLQAAQCCQALDDIRDRLHAKKHLINRRNRNVTGQYKRTRARNLIGRVGDRVTTHFKKYNHARDVLWALVGEVTFGGMFKEQRVEHLVLDGEDMQPDAVAVPDPDSVSTCRYELQSPIISSSSFARLSST